MRSVFYPIGFLLMTNLFVTSAAAQNKNLIIGTVEDITAKPVAYAVVYSVSGNKTITDSLGTFYLPANSARDSVYIIYNGMKSVKYAIPQNNIVNIIINIKPLQVSGKEEILKDVIVTNRNHGLDSLANRKEYAKIFNAKSSGRYFVEWLTNPLNIGNLFYALQFKKNKKQQFYKGFALTLEQENYVKTKFTKAMVTTYTGLTGEERDRFMGLYEPPYDAALTMNELDMAQYISTCFKEYQAKKK